MNAEKQDFSVGSVRRQIIAQAVPLTVAQVVQLLYNVVDRIYIGHLEGVGDMALTGLGVTFPVIVLIAAFTNLLGSGGAALFAIARGRGDEEEAQSILGNAFALLALASLVLFAICYPCAARFCSCSGPARSRWSTPASTCKFTYLAPLFPCWPLASTATSMPRASPKPACLPLF